MKHLRCPKRDLYIVVPQSDMPKVMSMGLRPEHPLTYYRRQAVHDAPHGDSVLVRVAVHDALQDNVRFYAGQEDGSFTVDFLSPAFMYVVGNIQQNE